jgi:hypothetical protein
MNTIDIRMTLREDEADTERLSQLALDFRDEIIGLDVEAVNLVREPSGGSGGSKGDPITAGSLLISLASAGVFTAIIHCVKEWALRREGRKITMKVKVGGNELDLAYNPTDTTEKEMTHFVKAVVGALNQTSEHQKGGEGSPP